MMDFVPTHIRACPDCLARKSPNNRREPMGHVPVSRKWEVVAMDILDITTLSDRGNTYILVVADYFTNYTKAYPPKSAQSVVDALAEHWMTRFGFPLTLHSDQGRQFENTVIHDLAALMGAVKTKTTPYRPHMA